MSGTIPLRTDHIDIVVVDSRPEDYGRLAASFATRDMHFQFAATASDALKIRRTDSRSIWLVNIHLPDGSGCELAAAIRAREPRSAVYLVGDAYDPVEEIAARSSGAAMYLCKPADPGWLATLPPRPLSRCA